MMNVGDSFMLGRAQREAADWKTYARQLERELHGTRANLAGNKALLQASLHELESLDPSNYLMVRQNRQRIYDAEYDAVLAGR